MAAAEAAEVATSGGDDTLEPKAIAKASRVGLKTTEELLPDNPKSEPPKRPASSWVSLVSSALGAGGEYEGPTGENVDDDDDGSGSAGAGAGEGARPRAAESESVKVARSV